MRISVFIGCCLLFLSLSVDAAEPVVLLDDDFSSYQKGSFSSVVGAHTEYHYLPEAAPKGNWAVTTFRSSVRSQEAWRVIEHDGEPAMGQFYKNSFKHYHPMVVTGDFAWRDYTIEAKFEPQTEDRLTGIGFRYWNDRCYYFCGVDQGNVVLKWVNHATAFRKPLEKVLAQAPLPGGQQTECNLKISITGDQIHINLNGVELNAVDSLFKQGKVSMMSDGPAVFEEIKVSTTAEELARINAEIKSREDEESQLQAANPKPVLWKKMFLDDFGVGRNLRFGDLNNDGQIDILVGQVMHHGPKDRNSEISCLTALTVDGEQLWQLGRPDAWKNHLTNDVAFQIHDLDNDGKTEVIFCKDLKIQIADGATGKIIKSVPTPKLPANTPEEYTRFPQALGDSLFFCDLSGNGFDGDLILKDRYLNVWSFDNDLNLKWSAQCNTGHYPYAYDVDDDGKDEIMVGYTLFDDDGKPIWSLDSKVTDHADGVAIVPFMKGEAPRLLCAASDEGMFFADMAGNVLKHHYLGHVQNPAVADFRPDMPGLEAISINFWGNQGIVHFYDARGDIYHDFEPCHHGSMCLPINWTGKPGEFWVLSPSVEQGGMFDGWGRKVVQFPADGHPEMCNAVLDLYGDARDEIVVWNPNELWIYTQDDNPLRGDLYKTTRNPLYNYSNYQTTVSIPLE
ncbi:hypothetical protein Pla110_37220 [Polystyrenella longa]|uniref:Rhamnogalacturonan lyase family 11 C-terminal domain-containing protein n=1 Tax=Polystyrenella longa TaxID=2528007 RepID=A0A518CRY0_9PLAN|nr:hypothetical protein [Polystyrenella longa]QDU81970.1 hypothetical protein Pla110_37220 [Polystyrenella longa]